MFGDVEAFDLEDRSVAGEGGNGVSGGDFALFAGEQGEIVVFPEDGGDVGVVLCACGAQVDHEGDAVAEIFYRDTGGGLGGVAFGGGGYVELGIGQGGEAGEVAELSLRSVDGVLFVGPVEGVELGGEPVEIVAD